jgi:hypothetical protein
LSDSRLHLGCPRSREAFLPDLDARQN